MLVALVEENALIAGELDTVGVDAGVAKSRERQAGRGIGLAGNRQDPRRALEFDRIAGQGKGGGV